MLSVLIWLCSHVAVAGVTVSLPASDQEVVFDDSADAAVSSGLEALASGRFSEAARVFHTLADAGGGAHASYLEAIARYEAGDLRRAARICENALSDGSNFGPLLALHGLVLTDLGQDKRAVAALDRASAVAGEDVALVGRIALSRALLLVDSGRAPAANEWLDKADEAAKRSGDEELASKTEHLRALAQGREARTDSALDSVVAKLRAGDVKAAREGLGTPREGDRRDGVTHLLASARVDRAVGDYDASNFKLRTALQLGREGGLIRETSAVLSELGTLYSLAGRFELAVAHHQEAVGLVAGTNHRRAELSYRIEAGRAAAFQGDLRQARDQLDVVAQLSADVADELVMARRAELAGLVSCRESKVEAGAKELASALEIYEQRSHWLDAARVATDLSGIYAGLDERASKKWGTRAVQHFERTGNPAGEAHVKVAQGLGLARNQQTEAALKRFVEAAKVADGLDSDRGRQLATHARENAARALVALGHSTGDTAGGATGAELDAVMGQQRAFSSAEALYESGKSSFEKGEYALSMDAFDDAVKAFEKLEEVGYAATARRGRGWAARNLALRKPAGTAAALFARAAKDGLAVGDAELRARAMAGHALAKAELSHKDALVALLAAADLAEDVGLTDDAAACLSEASLRSDDLAFRISTARRVIELVGPEDQRATYALYSVAVDAYEQDNYTLAISISDEILPHAGKLSDAVKSVRVAAVNASGAGED